MEQSNLCQRNSYKSSEKKESYIPLYEPEPEECCNSMMGYCGCAYLAFSAVFFTVATIDHTLGFKLFGEPSLLMKIITPERGFICHCEKIP